jgi:acetylornithine deacetylase/succinyl-diaminopimelate desuccinylase-like protein
MSPAPVSSVVRLYLSYRAILICLLGVRPRILALSSGILIVQTRKDTLMASPAVDFARSNQQRFLSELKDLLRIPSVSTLEEHKSDIQKAADFVAGELRRIGMENVEIIPTKGHPLIYADWLHAADQPTVLMYAHYDVQPPDPLDEWHTPPFEPTERNQNIYARGAVDDKGQLWMEVKALEALMQTGGGKLPINVKVIFEGEEEVGGESIAEYISRKPS